MQRKIKNNPDIWKTFQKYRLHHKAMFSITGVTGVILIWRGIWTFFDIAPVISNPFASLIVGFLLVIISGVFYKLI